MSHQKTVTWNCALALAVGLSLLNASSLLAMGADKTPTASPTSKPTSPDMTPNVKITEANNGKTVEAKTGDVVEIRLVSNATTGFEWAIAKNDESYLKPLGEPQYTTPHNAPPGTGGTQAFLFSAVKKGWTRIELHYARPWEKGKAPLQTFAVIVKIK